MRRLSTHLVALASIPVAALAGCGGEHQMTERDIRERFAIALRDGAASGMTEVSAKSIDPETLDLIDVRVYDGSHIMHADRAEILISPDGRTVSLRLHGVVGANTEEGRLMELPGFTTDPVKLPRRLVSSDPSSS